MQQKLIGGMNSWLPPWPLESSCAHSPLVEWVYDHTPSRPSTYRCFLKWWYPQNTPKWSCLVGKPMVVGYHHFRKPPAHSQKCPRKAEDLWNPTLWRSLGQHSFGSWLEVQLRFPKRTKNWGAYLKAGMLNAEMTWNDWSLLNFGNLEKFHYWRPQKKTTWWSLQHVTIMVCISCSSNPSVPTVINRTRRNATTQIEALLNMCCYQVFGGLVVCLFCCFLPVCGESSIAIFFNGHLSTFWWWTSNFVFRKRSKASYGHHRGKARPLLQSQPLSPLWNLCVWCCWPHCVTWVKRRQWDELVAIVCLLLFFQKM